MEERNAMKRTIVRETVRSRALGAVRNVRVYLPPGYDERVDYPAVYCQDGEQFFNFGRIATQATRLILEDGLPPFLIIGVDTDMPRRTAQYAPDGEQFADYCRFFVEEMLPEVEARYAIRRSAEGRILAGDSLGGTVSLHLALDHPGRFRTVLSLSGAFLAPTHARIARETDLRRLKMYMLIGTDETAVRTERGTYDFLEANREARRLLEARSAALRYVEKPGGHIWGFWQRELPEALKWLLAADSPLRP
jgi:enterochelin esterase-like enzyme